MIVRVAIVKSNYTAYGGGEKYALRLVGAFRERGIEVTLLSAKGGGWRKVLGGAKGVRVVCLPRVAFNNYLGLISFNRSVKRFLEKEKGFDIVLGMDRTERQSHLRAGGGCHAAWLERRGESEGRLRRLSFRINPYHRAMLRLERNAFTSPGLKKLIVNSRMAQGEIERHYGVAPEKITVIHNGVEWREAEGLFEESLLKRDELRAGLGLSAGRFFYFLFVGSGYERKGLEAAIRGLARLPSSTALLVAGKDKREARYQRLARKEGLRDRVVFLGPRRDVPALLQVADAFVLPTVYDPFSNATLEALAMGLYIVTSRANGCAEVIVEGAGRVIDDISDADYLAAAMMTALEGHPGKREIRESVRHLDFSAQLGRLVDACLED